MKPAVNSRAKGATFERNIATALRTNLGPDWTITRAGTDRQRGQAKDGHAGEYVITGPWRFPFAIECKKVEAFDEVHLWRDEMPMATLKLWRQAVRQASNASLAPMLVVRRNHGEILTFMRSHDAAAVCRGFPEPCMHIRLDGDAVTVVRWVDVLALGHWEDVKQ